MNDTRRKEEGDWAEQKARERAEQAEAQLAELQEQYDLRPEVAEMRRLKGQVEQQKATIANLFRQREELERALSIARSGL